MKLTYSQPTPLTQTEVLRRLALDDPACIAETLVAVGLFESDYDFAGKVVLDGMHSSNRIIRGAALIALAHLARVHSRVPVTGFEIVVTALADTDEYIRGQAETAADDIEQYVPGSDFRRTH